MIIEVEENYRSEFNKLASHPLQSWEWGEFRKKTGVQVIRLGKLINNKLTEIAQLTIHSLPFTSWNIGYLPKSGIPSKEMIEKMILIGKKFRCVFIKLEPNVVYHPKFQFPNFNFKITQSPHPLFPRYTYYIDLSKTEEELLKEFHPKTRYNLKLAQKHGVSIQKDYSDKGFSQYLSLLAETTKRQKFHAHSPQYHQLMWNTLKNPKPDDNQLSAHLLKAVYKNQTLVTWIVFLFNKILYYPYGASSIENKKVMASNLMMWEAIRFGKKNKAEIFDLWGALGPNPNPKDPWYGFHRFKQGYNPKLIEFIGSYDLIIEPTLYHFYNFTDKLRKIFLKIKSNFLIK